MALEPLTLAFDGDSNDGRQQSVNGADDGNRAPRLPRWTRQEILVLIQGKRVAESRVRRGRTVGLELGSGSGQVEPKWASVSSYCKKHGVNRGPVQCRKRWSNLAGDFKKIKEWECGIKEESESFWVMRNDLRRERKLPGFFDKEVYEILDRGSGGEEMEAGLALALAPAAAVNEPEALFDSGRSAAADEGLFSDFEQSEAGDKDKHMPIPAPTPISGTIPPITVCLFYTDGHPILFCYITSLFSRISSEMSVFTLAYFCFSTSIYSLVKGVFVFTFLFLEINFLSSLGSLLSGINTR